MLCGDCFHKIDSDGECNCFPQAPLRVERQNALAALSAHAIKRDSLPLPKIPQSHLSWCMCAFCATKK